MHKLNSEMHDNCDPLHMAYYLITYGFLEYIYIDLQIVLVLTVKFRSLFCTNSAFVWECLSCILKKLMKLEKMINYNLFGPRPFHCGVVVIDWNLLNYICMNNVLKEMLLAAWRRWAHLNLEIFLSEALPNTYLTKIMISFNYSIDQKKLGPLLTLIMN